MSKELPIGEQILLPGHFDGPVTLEAARPLTNGFECRVRLPDGTLEEAVLSEEEATALGKISPDGTTPAVANAEDVRLLVESTRIRLAYAHDQHFAVSLSGIRTLPHQIEAVYLKMLPQPRLRFLLADDPGAGKTIMAGLLIKEMKLREAIERVLILCPSPLTIQWQDEMLRWFGEPFDIIFSAVDQQQLTNPWQRSNLKSSLRLTTPSRTTCASVFGSSDGTWSSLTKRTSAAPTPKAPLVAATRLRRPSAINSPRT